MNLSNTSGQEQEGPEWPDQGRKVRLAEGLCVDRGPSRSLEKPWSTQEKEGQNGCGR